MPRMGTWKRCWMRFMRNRAWNMYMDEYYGQREKLGIDT